MDDLISRQAAIEAVMNHYRVGNKPQNEEMDWCAEMLSGLPTADLSEYCDKLWKTAYERGKAEARIIKLTEADKESLKKAMEEAELTLLPAEKKGKWVWKKHDEETGIDEHYFCSECGFPQGQIYTKFCAVCGARMED